MGRKRLKKDVKNIRVSKLKMRKAKRWRLRLKKRTMKIKSMDNDM